MTDLPDREAARRYAHLLIRELKQLPDYHSPQLKMIVTDDNGEVIHAIAFRETQPFSC